MTRDPAGPIRDVIEGTTQAHTIVGDREIGERPPTREERLPHECAGCGARYAGVHARDGCCLAAALEDP